MNTVRRTENVEPLPSSLVSVMQLAGNAGNPESVSPSDASSWQQRSNDLRRLLRNGRDWTPLDDL